MRVEIEAWLHSCLQGQTWQPSLTPLCQEPGEGTLPDGGAGEIHSPACEETWAEDADSLWTEFLADVSHCSP